MNFINSVEEAIQLCIAAQNVSTALTEGIIKLRDLSSIRNLFLEKQDIQLGAKKATGKTGGSFLRKSAGKKITFQKKQWTL